MKLPDHDTHMAEVQSLAEDARKTSTEAQHTSRESVGVTAPIFMGRDHETIPDRYVLHWSETTCRNCGHVEHSSDFFALSYIRSRVNGTRVRHLTKTSSPLYNLPVDRIRTGTHSTPYCAACTSIDLSHLPPPPEPSQLRDLPEPQLKGRGPKGAGERQVKEEKPKPKKGPASLDDLI
jgi:hypothetical protein